MPLSDTDIKDPVRVLTEHVAHRAPRDHSGSDAHDPVVKVGKVDQGFSKDLLKLLRCSIFLVLLCQLTGAEVEASRGVPEDGAILSRLVALSLDRLDMEQLRSLKVLDCLQHRDKGLDVIAINGTEVAHTEVLEEISLVGHQCLNAVIKALKVSLPRVGEEIELREPLRPHISELIILRTGDELD